MTNATTRANALPMPDRRAALGAIAAAGAILAAPRVARAAGASPDAELMAFAARVKALGAESGRAEDALDELLDAFEPPPHPRCLLIREDDDAFVGISAADCVKRVGEPIPEEKIKVVLSMRSALQKLLSTVEPNSPVNARATEGLARVTEIDIAGRQYLADVQAAKDAAGITAAEAAAQKLYAELGTAWRTLAFMPALTVEGALAKMDAVAQHFCRLNPEFYRDKCTADDVLEMAVVELTELRKAAEA